MKRGTNRVILAGVSALALASAAAAQDDAGFSISINGETMAGDDSLRQEARRADEALARANVQVRFDGLGVKPRLNAELLNDRAPRPGQTVRVKSEMNYPAFVTRAEMRVIDLGAPTGPRLLQVVPVAPNGSAAFPLPEGDNLAVVHRVYDARGRFDETRPVPLRAKDAPLTDRADPPPEEGLDSAARRRIPVRGGAVTVSGTDVRPGARVATLGETVMPDEAGRFVVQRILPAGDHAVDVRVSGAGESTFVQRDISIPRSEWFYTALADLTFGYRDGGGAAAAGGTYDRSYAIGRLAGYAKGKTGSGWTITARVDTGEDDLENLLRDLDEKDPYHLLMRMQRDRSYPTFGDDSTIEDGAPSDGKFYLKAERDGSHLLWGNYTATIQGSRYMRNERTLYGFQGVYRSPAQTAAGESRVSAEIYAASPDRLPGRDQFLGTGGSVYFLQRQDIGLGTETVSVQLRDRLTGRVVETRPLRYGVDYEINYIQGVVTLSAPLSGSAGGGTVITNPGGEYDVVLVVQYEYTPTATDVDGMSVGGRIEAWSGDRLRFGVTAMKETTDFADQTALGADIRYRLSDQSFIDLEYARTDGPGFGSSLSSDGGLIIDSSAGAGGTGSAWSVRGQLEFADLGLSMPGRVLAYWERRDAGFSTLDYQVTDDEKLWGLALDVEPTDRLGFRLYADVLDSASGKEAREIGAELTWRASDRLTWDLGIERLDLAAPGGPADENGARTDMALRATITQSDVLKWYVYGQSTLERSGGLERNDRVGVGLSYRFAPNWTFDGEISDGSLGAAGQALLTYQSDGYDSRYFGYRLEPGRDFAGVDLVGRDRGQFVIGGKRRLSDRLDVYGENTYDLFGRHQSLTSSYGVEYRHTDYLSYSAGFEMGRIDDSVNGDFDRNALSLGLRYDNPEGLAARARLELRRDRGLTAGTIRDADAFLLTAQARYKIDESRRLIFNLEHSDTDSDQSSILDGEYTDISLGYAYRPVLDDRLNLLFQYRYLRDMVGQRIDGTDTVGPRQESHVLSLDADYDLNPQWTLGAKVGVRISESSPSEGVAFAQNDAWLGVVNLRYHLVHNWDILLEARHLQADQAGVSETSFLGAVYRQFGPNAKIGLGYNFGSFSDDLTDLTYDDKGVFLNVIAKF